MIAVFLLESDRQSPLYWYYILANQVSREETNRKNSITFRGQIGGLNVWYSETTPCFLPKISPLQQTVRL